MDELQTKINNLYLSSNINLYEYNKIIVECVKYHEFAATVFVYDNMIQNNIKPNEFTFKTIEKLHSKTLPENISIKLKCDGKTRLQPRRRIHKIIKGHNYTENYQNALENLDKVKEFLNNNEHYKKYHKDKLSKILSKNCNTSIKDTKYIITNLKRTNFLPKNETNNTKITNFFKLNEPVTIDLNN